MQAARHDDGDPLGRWLRGEHAGQLGGGESLHMLDQLDEGVAGIAGEKRRRDLGGRSAPRLPSLRLGEQPSIVDREPRGAGQRFDQLLVLVRETAVDVIGQIEVA